MTHPRTHSGRKFFAGLLDVFNGVQGLARGYLRSHGPRTAHLAAQLGTALGRPRDEVARVIFAGVLADVGMIGMAEEAWEIPTPILDPRTRARVRRHPTRSQSILAAIPHLHDLGPAVRHHHEWWNGKGYPDGLAGEEIPMEARILRLADTVVALQAWRPHRGPMPEGEIRHSIRAGSGEEFDPSIAELFLSLADAGELVPFEEKAFRSWTAQAASQLLPDFVSPLSAAELLEILAAVVDAKDPYTAGHSRRVALLSVALAERLGLDEDTRDALWAGGYLHDIGKLGVPLRILTKPGRLTDEERAVVREHPGMGAEVLVGVPALSHLAVAARHHHERWDGAGYPDGLSGERIPLVAQILAVADTYDAMTTSRAYRGSRGHLVALEEIAREAGHQFAPDVARAFLSLPERLFEELRQPRNRQAGPVPDPPLSVGPGSWQSH